MYASGRGGPRRGKNFSVALFLALTQVLTACSGDAGTNDAGAVERKLRSCVEQGGLSPHDLPIDLNELDTEKGRVLDACLAEQGLTRDQATAQRRKQVELANAFLRRELDCMKEKGWTMPEPSPVTGGLLVVEEPDRYDKGQQDAFLRDRGQCARVAQKRPSDQRDIEAPHSHDDGHDHDHAG